MPEKRKKSPPRTKKRQKKAFFHPASFHRTAIFILSGFIILAAGTGIYLRSEINRRIKEELESARNFYESGEYAKALSAVHRALEKKPGVYAEPSVKYIKAASLMETSEEARAREILEEIVSAGPGGEYYPPSLYRLASADKEKGMVEQAARALEKIVENYPRDRVVPFALFELAEIQSGMRRWSGAVENYERIIEEFPGTDVSSRAKDELGKLNIYLLHSPMITEHDIAYNVRPGDTIQGIATRHNTTRELIMKANGLRSTMIPVGKRLKITPSNFEIFVDADENTLSLMLNGRFFKRYRVGTGEYGKTPIGEFRITNKTPYPTWFAGGGAVYEYGDPKNILGTRWLGLDLKGYGIHGTFEPESIGRHETAGCVRMLNEDVEELFDMVIEGTPVTITGTSLPDAW